MKPKNKRWSSGKKSGLKCRTAVTLLEPEKFFFDLVWNWSWRTFDNLGFLSVLAVQICLYVVRDLNEYTTVQSEPSSPYSIAFK